MLQKAIEEIGETDIKELVENAVPESQVLDYKAELPGNSHDSKKEFLADASALANTRGGDLLYGIRESGGKPEEVIGIQSTDVDADISRLENILRDGLQPRTDVQMKNILVDGKQVLLVRVPQSLEAPHRVIAGNHNQFYLRHTNGKHPMDIDELRNAFLRSKTVIDTLREFREQRVREISRTVNDRLIIHIIPLESLRAVNPLNREQLLDLKKGGNVITTLSKPPNASGWNSRINFEGIRTYPPSRDANYLQVYRDKKIEAVHEDILRKSEEEGIKIPITAVEEGAISYSRRYLELLEYLGTSGPYYIFITLTNLKDSYIPEEWSRTIVDGEKCTVNDILLPEVVVERSSDDLGIAMREVFDMVWNAYGVSKSLNYDEDGNRKVRS